MPTSSSGRTSAAIVYGTAGSVMLALLVTRHGTDLAFALHIALSWGTSVLLLLLRPSTPNRRLAINVLGTWSWAVRALQALRGIFTPMHGGLDSLLHKGVAFPLMAFVSLFHMIATHHMWRVPRLLLATTFACLFAHIATTVLPAGAVAPPAAAPAAVPSTWWRTLQLYTLSLLCVYGPYELLIAARKRWQQAMHGGAPQAGDCSCTISGPCGCPTPKAPARKPARHVAKRPRALTVNSSDVAVGPAAAVATAATPLEAAATAAATAPPAAVPTAGTRVADDTSGDDFPTEDTAGSFSAWTSPSSQLLQQCVPSYASTMSLVHTIKTKSYKSQLGPRHKVCMKLATDRSCSSLPPDMATHMQRALSRVMGPSSLRISELGVRPGCIMLTMGLRHMMLATSPATTEQPLVARDIGRAMLQQLCGGAPAPATPEPMTTVGDGSQDEELPAGYNLECTRALMQLDMQLLSAVWQQEAGWVLQAVKPEPLNSAESSAGMTTGPWLGVVTSCHQLPYSDIGAAGSPSSTYSAAAAAAAGSSSNSAMMVALGVEVQLWQLGKLDEVEGWAPPAEGHHAFSAPGYNTGAAAAAVGGRELQLLARGSGGAYLATRVRRVSRGAAPSAATVQMMVYVPASQLMRHGGALDPARSPSQLLLLSLELWEGEVLCSTTPLLAATHTSAVSHTATPAAATPAAAAGQVAAGMRVDMAMKPWWWGASDAAVDAVLSEVQLCSVALSESDEDVADALSNHLDFMTDLAEWLQGVQHCVRNHPSLCSIIGGTSAPGLLTPPSLPLEALQRLGKGLMAHAAELGLHGIHSMLQQQMRRVVQPSLQLQQRESPLWLRALWEAMTGHACHMCEHSYKQKLARQLNRVQVASSAGTALCAFAGGKHAVADGSWPYLLVCLPWMLFHLLSVWASMSAPPTADPAVTLRWSAAAYVWKSASRVVLELGLLRHKQPYISWFWRSTKRWVLTHSLLAVTEQMQASTVLPARWILAVAALLDLPNTLIRSASAHTTWPMILLNCALTPLVTVGLRLTLDASFRVRWWRRLTQRAAQDHHEHAASGFEADGMASMRSDSECSGASGKSAGRAGSLRTKQA